MHFFKDFGQVGALKNFSILNFEKVVTTVTREVNEDAGVCVGLKSHVFWILSRIAPSKKVQNGLVRQVIRFEIHFNIITIEVFSSVQKHFNGTRRLIPWITRMILRQHQYDSIVWHALRLEVLINGHDIASMPVVEIELRGTHQHIEVVLILCVQGRGGAEEKGTNEEEQEMQNVGRHWVFKLINQ